MLSRIGDLQMGTVHQVSQLRVAAGSCEGLFSEN